jgi:hypothetical protein
MRSNDQHHWVPSFHFLSVYESKRIAQLYGGDSKVSQGWNHPHYLDDWLLSMEQAIERSFTAFSKGVSKTDQVPTELWLSKAD